MPQEHKEAAAAAGQLLDVCHLSIAQALEALAVNSAASYSGSGAVQALEESSAQAAFSPAQMLLTALTALQRLAGAAPPVLAPEDLESLAALVQGCLQQMLRPQTLLQTSSNQGREDLTAHLLTCARILLSVAAASEQLDKDSSGACHLDERLASACLAAISTAAEAGSDSGSAEQQAVTDSALAAVLQASQKVCQMRPHLAPPLLSAALGILRRSRSGVHSLLLNCFALWNAGPVWRDLCPETLLRCALHAQGRTSKQQRPSWRQLCRG